MKLWQLSRLLLDDCPASWDRAAMLAEVERLNWVSVGVVNDIHGCLCDVEGRFQVEPGGLIRPTPGENATVWIEDKIHGIHTVRLRVLEPGWHTSRLPHPTIFEKVLMVDQIVLGTYDPPPQGFHIGHKDGDQANCARSNLYWDWRKKAKWE